MFMMVGVNEHLLVIEASPYGEALFDGKPSFTLVQSKHPVIVAGNSAHVDGFHADWASKDDGQPVEMSELLARYPVIFINKPEDSKTPVVHFFERTALGDRISAVTTQADLAFTVCHPKDEQSHLVTELKLAVMDFINAGPDRTDDAVLHITQFIHSVIELPDDHQITYVDFLQGKMAVVAANNPTPDVTH